MYSTLSHVETVPLLGVPGGSLFTLTLRGLLVSPSWSWVGDCSLSWGDGEWSWGDGDCKWGRDWGWDRGDWSWGIGDWSWTGGWDWGFGEWSWGPPPGVVESSPPCLAPLVPLRPGISWVRGSMSTGPPETWEWETESEAETNWNEDDMEKGKMKGLSIIYFIITISRFCKNNTMFSISFIYHDLSRFSRMLGNPATSHVSVSRHWNQWRAY